MKRRAFLVGGLGGIVVGVFGTSVAMTRGESGGDNSGPALAGGNGGEPTFDSGYSAVPARTASGMVVFVLVTLANTGDGPAERVEVEIVVRNEAGEFLDQSSKTVTSLAAGEEQELWYELPASQARIGDGIGSVDVTPTVIE